MLVQWQRQPETSHEFQYRSDEGVEDGVEDRQPEDVILHRVLVVLQPDEDTIAADARISEAEPDAEAPAEVVWKQTRKTAAGAA